jgi:hypothetical protein
MILKSQQPLKTLILGLTLITLIILGLTLISIKQPRLVAQPSGTCQCGVSSQPIADAGAIHQTLTIRTFGGIKCHSYAHYSDIRMHQVPLGI